MKTCCIRTMFSPQARAYDPSQTHAGIHAGSPAAGAPAPTAGEGANTKHKVKRKQLSGKKRAIFRRPSDFATAKHRRARQLLFRRGDYVPCPPQCLSQAQPHPPAKRVPRTRTKTPHLRSKGR